MADGKEFETPITALIAYGRKLFVARFTSQDGAGRPLTKGTGDPLSDPNSPLVFPRNFNRFSGPDSNSCSGCHNLPRPGGAGDRATEVFVLGQRFDFLTFDHDDTTPLRGTIDESGRFVTTKTAFDERRTIGMFGSGFIEMLARQMTADLQAERDATPPGTSRALESKGLSFGILTHNADGSWDTSRVDGISALSLQTRGDAPPSLIIRPFAQASNVISIRQFTNNAFNQHLGMQAEERFGLGVDADGDGVANELTTADITATSIFQATLPVPGQVIPNDPTVEHAILRGQQMFSQIGCATCHIPALPLTANNNPGLPGQPGWIYSEPSPYNPPGNLRPGPTNYPTTAPPLTVDLTSDDLPGPRLRPVGGTLWVPAYTDLKLHDITSGLGDPSAEPLDQNQPAGSPAFFAGNRKFLTAKLWGFYNENGSFMPNGKCTTAREAIEQHNGEALDSRRAFDRLSAADRDDIVEFLKSLRVLPRGAKSLVVDEHGSEKTWPPR
ncbi:MAG: thiol oxidoreductase [Acidobacteriota bacterium]|nr:thiol oxidoreductase [Acidobacteriota bacterium]